MAATIARQARGATILSLLRHALSRESMTLRTAVAPYVYLVALSMQPDIKYLSQASMLSAPYHTWYNYLSDVLLKTYQPTTIRTVAVPPARKIVEPRIVNASDNKYTILLEG
jgi:hypothetical protein